VTLIDCFWNDGISLAIVGLTIWSKVKVKVNYPISGLDRPLGLQDFKVPRFSIYSAHEVCQPSALAAFTPRRYQLLFFFARG
jgi:hypothetical protein